MIGKTQAARRLLQNTYMIKDISKNTQRTVKTQKYVISVNNGHKAEYLIKEDTDSK